MNTFKWFTFSICSILFVLSSCTSDGENKEMTKDQLTGQWDLISASRDGNETSSLEGTFLNFTGDKMTCNFTGEEVNTNFTFNKNQISQGNQVYKIERFSDSELILATKLMDFDFVLTFSKVEE